MKKTTLYKKHIEKIGKNRIMGESALAFIGLGAYISNDVMTDGSDKDEPKIEDSFFQLFREVYISVEIIVEMLDRVQKEQLWTALHEKLCEMENQLHAAGVKQLPAGRIHSTLNTKKGPQGTDTELGARARNTD